MINGMTGFGSAQFSDGKVKGVVEIKSLNHRYFDINYYLPIGFGSLEDKIKQILSRSIMRGRVSVSVKITERPGSVYKFNRSAARQYMKDARALSKSLGLRNDLSLSDLVRLPGVVDSNTEAVTADKVWPLLDKNIRRAVNGLVQMRKREGKSLSADIRKQLDRMRRQISHVKKRSTVILAEKRKYLVDDEFSSYQKSTDVNEELARLAHYIDEMKAMLRAAASSGKKIDFIAQEMQRETNTIGSKLQDKIVSNAVIALKSKIEKIREQSQNIE